MFEWLCNIGTIWGLILTGVGVIIGGMGVIVAICCVIYWTQELWNAIPYRVTEPIERVGRGIGIAFIVVFLLAAFLVLTMMAYDQICG